MPKITEKRLQTLKPTPGKKTADLAICDGLSVHVRETAAGTFSRSYVFRYRLGGKIIKESLGSLNDITLSDALLMCNERKRFVLQGQRPAKAIHKIIEKEINKAHFADAAEIYVAKRADLSKNTHLMLEQMLKAIKPLMSLAFDDLEAAQGRDIVLKYVKKKAYVKARKIADIINGITETAIDAGMTEANPFTRLKRLIPAIKVQHQKSVDPDNAAEEIKAVLHALASLPINRNYKMYFLAGLFLLMRPSEVGGLLIEDLDRAHGVIRCRHTKTRANGWTVKLDPPLDALLSYLIGGRKRGRIFPFPVRNACASVNRIFIKNRICMSCHGWRAAGAAWMVHNGISIEIADACLSHKIRNAVTAAYIRTDFPEERAAAMLRWHQFLVGIVREIPIYCDIFKNI